MLLSAMRSQLTFKKNIMKILIMMMDTKKKFSYQNIASNSTAARLFTGLE